MLKTLFIILVAFVLGFLSNEYFHQQQRLENIAPQVGSDKRLASEQGNNKEDNKQSDEQSLPLQSVTENPASITDASANIVSLVTAERLLMNNQALEAIRFLRTTLDNNPASAQAWLLLVRAYQMSGNHSEAVASWSRYLQYEFDPHKLDQAKTAFKHYLLKLAAGVPADLDTAWLAQQLNDYIQLTADDPELHLAAAGLYVAAKDTYQAQYHALMAANHTGTQERAETILAQLNGTTPTNDLTLPLTRFGNQFLVAVNIEGYPARLLLDTGASITGVSAAYIQKYPAIVKATKPIRLNTANGAVESYLFTVTQLSLGDAVFNQHIIARLPLDAGIEFDGLLGVDVLGRFDFVIDQNEAVLRLGKRR